MKKVGKCEKCEREVYTNDFNLCKRCHQVYGAQVAEEIAQEETQFVPEEPSVLK